jgi:hypothetical protein
MVARREDLVWREEVVRQDPFSQVQMVYAAAQRMLAKMPMALLLETREMDISDDFLNKPLAGKERLIEKYPDVKELRGDDLTYLRWISARLSGRLELAEGIFGEVADGIKSPQGNRRKIDKQGLLDEVYQQPEMAMVLGQVKSEKSARAGRSLIKLVKAWINYAGQGSGERGSAKEKPVEEMSSSKMARDATLIHFFNLYNLGLADDQIKGLYGYLVEQFGLGRYLDRFGHEGIKTLLMGTYGELEVALDYLNRGHRITLGNLEGDNLGVDLIAEDEEGRLRFIQVKGEWGMREIDCYPLGDSDRESIDRLGKRLGLIEDKKMRTSAYQTLGALRNYARGCNALPVWCYASSNYVHTLDRMGNRLTIDRMVRNLKMEEQKPSEKIGGVKK